MTTSGQADVFIWSAEPQLANLRDACLHVTWQAGRTARGILSTVAPVDLGEEIRKTNIFVCLCRQPAESVQRECAWAADCQKTVLLFVFDPDPNSDLTAFRDAVSNTSQTSIVTHLVSEDPHVFTTAYLVALHRVGNRPSCPSAKNLEASSFPEAYSQHPFFRRILDVMERWPVVRERYGQNERLKQAVANFFLDLYLSEIVKGQVTRIFFESGSSIAVLSELLLDRLGEEWLRMSANIDIETNNVLAYIYCVLAQSSKVLLYPSGPPETKYGATFGPLESLDLPVDNLAAHPIEGPARVVTDRIRDYFSESYMSSGLILGATSGIDFTRGSEGFGPHCGSYKNMLFKRALLESGCPVMLFLDQDKVARPFIHKRCFAVCDSDFPWEYACRNKPVALACAFWNEETAWPVIEEVQSFGFGHVEHERRSERPWCFIVSNDRFQEVRRGWLHKSADRPLIVGDARISPLRL